MNKLKKYIFIILIYSCIYILCGCNLHENKKTDNLNKEINNSTITNNNSLSQSNQDNNSLNEKNTQIETTQTSQLQVEDSINQLVSEFSTDIKSKSSNRLNNIQITCNELNNTIIDPHTEFSFCNTIGKSTEDKGYKKADVIINKKIVQALGGRKLSGKLNTI